jgi:hypothetical protein
MSFYFTSEERVIFQLQASPNYPGLVSDPERCSRLWGGRVRHLSE